MTTRNQQVARIDYENDVEIDGRGRSGDRARASPRWRARSHAIVVSDYLKGVVSAGVAAAAIDSRAARTGIPLLVDPKVPHIGYYGGATIDHAESPRGGSGDAHADPLRRDDAREAARRFRERAGLRVRADHARRARHVAARRATTGESELPAEAREVADVTGAGDTVISALALAVAAGASLDRSRAARQSRRRHRRRQVRPGDGHGRRIERT